jgi:translation initiation factor 1
MVVGLGCSGSRRGVFRYGNAVVQDETRRPLTDNEPVTQKGNARLIYSTDTSGKCPGCGWPQRNCQCSSQREATEAVPARVVAKLRMEKKGRGGKTVTVVYGLPRNAEFLRELSQDLKRACGAGGTATEDGVEIQGDLRERVRDALMKRGYVVKG